MLDQVIQTFRELATTGVVAQDAPAFLLACGRADLADHCRRVALEAARLADAAGVDCQQAIAAAWLHDLGVLVPPDGQVAAALRFGLEPLPEELRLPFLLHQKVSAELARALFGITAPPVLAAIRCHTTLRADATALDKLLFVADKRSWDAADQPPDLPAADLPLDQAVAILLRTMRATPLPVVHPWLRAAYEQVTGTSWEGAEAP